MLVPLLTIPVNNTDLFAVKYAASLFLACLWGDTLVRKLPFHQNER